MLKTRLDAQNKKFDQDIRGVCDARNKLEETAKTRQERIESLEHEMSELKEQTKCWFTAAEKINALLISKFINLPFPC